MDEKDVIVKTVERSFECLGDSLNSYRLIAVYLQSFQIFCNYETLYMQHVFSSENGLKLTYDNVEVQKFSASKTPGPPDLEEGRGIMLGGICLQASGGDGRP